LRTFANPLFQLKRKAVKHSQTKIKEQILKLIYKYFICQILLNYQNYFHFYFWLAALGAFSKSKDASFGFAF
jgi:hypothetical protein